MAHEPLRHAEFDDEDRETALLRELGQLRAEHRQSIVDRLGKVEGKVDEIKDDVANFPDRVREIVNGRFDDHKADVRRELDAVVKDVDEIRKETRPLLTRAGLTAWVNTIVLGFLVLFMGSGFTVGYWFVTGRAQATVRQFITDIFVIPVPPNVPMPPPIPRHPQGDAPR